MTLVSFVNEVLDIRQARTKANRFFKLSYDVPLIEISHSNVIRSVIEYLTFNSDKNVQ